MPDHTTRPEPPIRVVVTDIDISFNQLINLIFKATMALIPAGLCIAIVYYVIVIVLFGMCISRPH